MPIRAGAVMVTRGDRLQVESRRTPRHLSAIPAPRGAGRGGDRAARDARDKEIIDEIADELNAEIADALEYQVPL